MTAAVQTASVTCLQFMRKEKHMEEEIVIIKENVIHNG